MLNKEKKKEIIEKLKKSPNDTGSITIQITILTERMNELMGHFKNNPKDFSSRRGFLKLINKRKKLLSYLKKSNHTDYDNITKKLNIRQ